MPPPPPRPPLSSPLLRTFHHQLHPPGTTAADAALQQQLPKGTRFAVTAATSQLPSRYGDLWGRAEVTLPDGRRGSVCARGWGNDLASDLCAQRSSSWRFGVPTNGSVFGQPSQLLPVLVADIRCPGLGSDAAGAAAAGGKLGSNCTATVYDSAAEAAADGCGLDQAAGVTCFLYDCECKGVCVCVGGLGGGGGCACVA